ncbi:ASCH domain-containing protein [Leptotrichia sp. OH3620_COT-345]|uniref:ASCH domain-containing protein n=1 Tax=Leptotrichia sp. OH3620_COT-345 TaxID=2491048 RepID=UPI000F65242D|nr:ASCH domain-containing protein [Leptotrichia sp. OH3620_COT-345]RRD39668.1 ASCH domain-containing protein [Leptotrichia sp. OH3620_COT-345]
MNKLIEKYLLTLSEEERKNVHINKFAFGYEENIQDALADLVLKGEKKATTSLYVLYDLENERVPKKGDINIILNSKGEEVCITINTKVYRTPFKDVTKEFAFKEGEGDKSLEYWRKVHIDFFMEETDGKFTEDMEVLCEEFELME